MKSRREIVHVILCLHLYDFLFMFWWFLFKWMYKREKKYEFNEMNKQHTQLSHV